MSDMEKKEILGQEKNLEKDEMDAVAGGKTCYCGFGGGGEADAGGKTCACVMGGGGEYNDETATHHGSKVRCICVVAGGGSGGDHLSERRKRKCLIWRKKKF